MKVCRKTKCDLNPISTKLPDLINDSLKDLRSRTCDLAIKRRKKCENYGQCGKSRRSPTNRGFRVKNGDKSGLYFLTSTLGHPEREWGHPMRS